MRGNHFILFLTLSFFMAACGGGSGGGNPAQPTITFNTLNAGGDNSSVGLDSSNFYQYNVTAGNSYFFTLTISFGDADLAIYRNSSLDSSSLISYSINSGTTQDEVYFAPTTDQTVYIEVYGFEASDYTLTPSVQAQTTPPPSTPPQTNNNLFDPYVKITVGSYLSSAAIADVNNDGMNDILVTSTYSNGGQNDSKLFVLLQNINGGFQTPVRYDTGLQPSYRQPVSVTTGDVNNDGRTDVIISYTNGIGVYLQNNQGTLDPIVVYQASTNYPNTQIQYLRTGDFNNDGKTDVAALGHDTTKPLVFVYLQNNNGTLNTPTSHDTPLSGYEELEAGDVNGDGLDDLVVLSAQHPFFGYSVLLQQNGGGFSQPVQYPFSVFPNTSVPVSGGSIALGDINNDNRNDIVVPYGGNKPDSLLALYTQDQTGNLNYQQSLSSYDIPQAVQIGDVNGDGRNDVVVFHSAWSKFGVYLQNQDGTLATEVTIPTLYADARAEGMVLGDVNSDAKNDVVFVSYDSIYVHYNIHN